MRSAKTVTVGRSLALLLSLVMGACSGTSSRLDAANEARHAGRPREALKGYQEVLATLGDATLSSRDDALRLRALKYAADVSYLDLGDFMGAVSYYRRIVALYPNTEEAWRARSLTGDIYRDRFGDRMAAIAQWAEIAGSDAPIAAEYQLKVAREYLDLKNWAQARTEARILRDRWPTSDLADEGQLLTAQAWVLEQRPAEATRAFQALLERKPRPDMAARALEGQAGIAASQRQFDRAIALYERALASHPRPDVIRIAIERVRARRNQVRPAHPGDRATAFDRNMKSSDKESP